MTGKDAGGGNRGGVVNSDVSYFRDTPGLIRYPSLGGVTCHKCGVGEVYHPMQTCAPPTVITCLRCGLTDPSDEFNRP